MSDQTQAGLREEVRERYAQAARVVLARTAGTSAGCCGSSADESCCGSGSAALDSADCFGSQLYGKGETDGLPEEAVLASLGCGNPVAVADLLATRPADTGTVAPAFFDDVVAEVGRASCRERVLACV